MKGTEQRNKDEKKAKGEANDRQCKLNVTLSTLIKYVKNHWYFQRQFFHYGKQRLSKYYFLHLPSYLTFLPFLPFFPCVWNFLLFLLLSLSLPSLCLPSSIFFHIFITSYFSLPLARRFFSLFFSWSLAYLPPVNRHIFFINKKEKQRNQTHFFPFFVFRNVFIVYIKV